MNPKDWQRLGTLPPRDLVPARLELHWAAQLPAALGIARATPTPDFAQHALSWDEPQRALVSALVPGSRPYRAGLRLAERELVLLNAKGTLIEGLPLGGHTLREALAWLEEVSARHTGANAAPLALAEHEMPAHPLAEGGRFGGAEPAHAAELARWFGNLERVLHTLTAGRAASPVRVWSHHFDMDSVLALGGERTLGFGFSPGDDSYAEPYLYALPTPYPDEHALAPLPAPMEWVTDGWIGAVLRGSGVVRLESAAQAELVAGFYAKAEAALAL